MNRVFLFAVGAVSGVIFLALDTGNADLLAAGLLGVVGLQLWALAEKLARKRAAPRRPAHRSTSRRRAQGGYVPRAQSKRARHQPRRPRPTYHPQEWF